MSLSDIIQQAQAMQTNLNDAQNEIKALKVEGESDDSAVKLVLSGNNECLRVMIDSSLMAQPTGELQSRIQEAYNSAKTKVDTARKEKEHRITGGVNLPPGYRLPI